MKVFYKQSQVNPAVETDYSQLLNKPSINGVELAGDQSTEQIKVTWFGTQAEFDALGTYDPFTIYIIDDGTPAGDDADYLDLQNKPAINSQVLTGNKLSSDLNMYTSNEIDNMLASMRSVKVVTSLPAAPVANTMYYLGPIDSEGTYHIYLYDSVLTQIDLGTSKDSVYTGGTGIDIDANKVVSVKIDNASIKTNSSNELYAQELTAATSSAAGSKGIVPAPGVNSNPGNKVLVDNATWKNIADFMYPVGSIYMSTTLDTAAKVQAAFGGTWTAWGAGKVPVGIDTSDNDFKTVEKTGGAKTHSHGAGTYGARFMLQWNNSWNSNKLLWQTRNGNQWTASGSTDRASDMFHYNEPDVGTYKSENYAVVAGTSGSASTLQPYITCYMWKRTA